jgi:hypothetical protein
MGEARECISLVRCRDCNDVRSVEVRRKVRNQIVVWFSSSVIDVAGGRDKQNSCSVSLVQGGEEVLTE